MKNEMEKMDDLFSRFSSQWDVEEPAAGHHDRFLDRLQPKKKKFAFPHKFAMSVAAILLVMLGVFVTYKPSENNENAFAKASPQVRETHYYFAGIIEKELAKVEKESTPETQRLVKDALFRMQGLEKEYDKLTNEMLKRGENKQLIHAMITNLQTRISFLEDVLLQIENTKKIKETYNENNQI